MGLVVSDITMSLDGFVAGPNATIEEPLGEGGERLHEWITGLQSWRAEHGLEGGETGPDDDVFKEFVDANGAFVMGRRMFSGGEGPWEEDAKADGWWGDDPPFKAPVFVVTHHARETVEKQGGTSFVFVTDGIESAVAQAREAAGDKNVAIAGGASVTQQCLQAGLVDEMQIHVAPLLLGDGVRLFDGGDQAQLEPVRVLGSPAVTHLKYRVRRG